jgi:hypothetical protein
VNGPILPSTLTALPSPWCLSSDEARGDAIDELPRDTKQRRAALSAVLHSLDFLVDDHTRYGDEESDELPEEFYDTWIFFERRFNERMPTLSDVTTDAIRDWLVDEVNPGVLFGMEWTAPPPALIEAVGRFWAVAKVGSITRQALRWLRNALRDDPGAPERAPLLSVLKTAAPRVSWRTGQMLIGRVWDIGGVQERSFLIEVENDPDVPEETRQEAARLRMLGDRTSEEAAAGQGNGS